MPSTAPVATADDLRHCIRDLVALSTLPAAWLDYDTRQIGENIVAALITMLAADFVLMMLPSKANRTAELTRSDPKLNPSTLDDVRAMLGREKAALDVERKFVVADTFGGDSLHIAIAPIGLGGDAVHAGGFFSPRISDQKQKTSCSGADHAATALWRWSGDADKRMLITLVQQSTDLLASHRLQ